MKIIKRISLSILLVLLAMALASCNSNEKVEENVVKKEVFMYYSGTWTEITNKINTTLEENDNYHIKLISSDKSSSNFIVYVVYEYEVR